MFNLIHPELSSMLKIDTPHTYVEVVNMETDQKRPARSDEGGVVKDETGRFDSDTWDIWHVDR